MNTKQLTAPCGLACWACGIYIDNITEEVAQATAERLNMPIKDVACHGCRSEKGCSLSVPMTQGKGCKTKECVASKGLHNCSECNEFPCDYLMPVADMANMLPHNTKIYNLSRIRLIGLKEWAKEAPMTQQKYFKGKFVYGQAPSLNESL